MFFVLLESSCLTGLIFALVILFKLGRQGRNINFINVMFINVFLYEVIVGPFLIHGFFSAARVNWGEDPEPGNSVSFCGTW